MKNKIFRIVAWLGAWPRPSIIRSYGQLRENSTAGISAGIHLLR